MSDRATRVHSPSRSVQSTAPEPSCDRNFKPLVLGQNQSDADTDKSQTLATPPKSTIARCFPSGLHARFWIVRSGRSAKAPLCSRSRQIRAVLLKAPWANTAASAPVCVQGSRNRWPALLLKHDGARAAGTRVPETGGAVVGRRDDHSSVLAEARVEHSAEMPG
jgi:hypothetical protein